MSQISTREPAGLGPVALILIGVVCGLAWSAALRAWMRELAGAVSVVDWLGTFGAVLVPGVLTGALLGWAEHLRRHGGAPGWRWLALAPLSFAIAPMLEPGALTAFLTMGLGGGAVGVAVFAIIGGFALSGRGSRWGRAACGLVAVAFVVAIAFTTGAVGGSRLAILEPRGAWVALLGASLMVVLALASAIPQRAVVSGRGSAQ